MFPEGRHTHTYISYTLMHMLQDSHRLQVWPSWEGIPPSILLQLLRDAFKLNYLQPISQLIKNVLAQGQMCFYEANVHEGSLKPLLDKPRPEPMINDGESSSTFTAQSWHKTDVNHSPADALNRHHLFQSLVTCVKGQIFLSHNRSQLIRTTVGPHDGMTQWGSV